MMKGGGEVTLEENMARVGDARKALLKHYFLMATRERWSDLHVNSPDFTYAKCGLCIMGHNPDGYLECFTCLMAMRRRA